MATAARHEGAGVMSADTDGSRDAARASAAELAQVHGQIASARVRLADLKQDVAAAEGRLHNLQASPLLAANEQLVLTALRNQAEAESAARTLAAVSRAAELDALTQLPNRALMLDRCGQAIAIARRHGRQLALLFVDLNHFKQINDRLGHAAGDEVLKIAAQRFVAAVRDADTVSRHGGDEFVILLTEVTRPADAGRIADGLAAALAAPSRAGGQEVRLSASIGIAIYPDDGEDATTLLDRADMAMYTARRLGLGGKAFYGAAATVQGTPQAAADDPSGAA
jgi:diguanylate cyclase (GGDEF)-like protein